MEGNQEDYTFTIRTHPDYPILVSEGVGYIGNTAKEEAFSQDKPISDKHIREILEKIGFKIRDEKIEILGKSIDAVVLEEVDNVFMNRTR